MFDSPKVLLLVSLWAREFASVVLFQSFGEAVVLKGA